MGTQGSRLDGQGLVAISALLEALEDGLNGRLQARYYLSSIDPGMGKTLSMSCFLRAWKDEEFRPASSVLVAVGRLDHIGALISNAGLAQSDVAVVTSDENVNALGVPEGRHRSAPVMLTTHEMIRSRTRNTAFSDASSFHFQGHSRTLRIWDETLVLAKGVVLRIDDLSALAKDYRQSNPGLIAAVEDWQQQLASLEPDRVVTVPSDFADLIPGYFRKGRHNDTLRALSDLSGREVLYVKDPGQGGALAGFSPGLPDDLMPMVIMDASGRVRPTYQLWDQHRGTLERLPDAVNDYSNLEVHLWQRGSGKVSMARSEARATVVNAVAAIINQDATSKWLVVHYKDIAEIVDELRLIVDHDADSRVASLTWGMHDATNEYKDYENVIVVGQLTYGGLNVQALACGAAGSPLADLHAIDTTDFQWGEFQHNLLQALSRASVRKSVNGVAGRCKAYVIATPSEQTDRRVADTFPGCQMVAWVPPQLPLAGHVAQAAQFLRDTFSDSAVRQVSKGTVRTHLGMRASNFSRDILKHPQFIEFLENEDIRTYKHQFLNPKVHFTTKTGEGWVWDGPELATAEEP